MGINPRPAAPLVVIETPAAVVIDGDNGLGQVASVQAMELAIAKVRGERWAGRRQVIEPLRRCRLLCHAGLQCRHDRLCHEQYRPDHGPVGRRHAHVWQQSPAHAVPAPTGPFVLDIATSVVARGKIEAALARGEAIPAGWAYDRHGRPTNDPYEALNGGMLLPFAGHKGYGIALLIDILSGVLTGGAFGRQVANLLPYEGEGNVGYFFGAIDTANFVPPESFGERMAAMVRDLKSSALARRIQRSAGAGWLENGLVAAHGSSVALPEHVWQSCQALAVELDLGHLIAE